jgi:ribose-phosphate pyrophosphokinase
MILLNKQEIKFETFPNGETKLIHDNIEGLLLKNGNEMSFKYENDADLIKLMFIKNYIDEYYKNILIDLVIYYMPYSRMDRSEDYSPFTLKYVSKFINNLNFDSITVIEPHSEVTCALLDRVFPAYINFNLVEEVKAMVGFDEDKDYIVFPDAGASKRYSKMKAQNTLFCTKIRNFVTGDIEGLELVGDTSKAYGRTAIIVDDLSSYGGTFIHTADRLREEGFVEVNLLVAHAENVIFKRNERTGKLLFEHVEKIFTTDSVLTEHNNEENAKFESQLHVFKIEGDVVNEEQN